MTNFFERQILLGSKKNQISSDNDITLDLPLEGNLKEVDEFDRSSVISLAQVFDDERQESTFFRPTFKLDLIFANQYSGLTSTGGSNTDYQPFTNYLYYVNGETSFNSIQWSGFPQYFEFDLIRTDNNVSGYTTNNGSTPPHVSFINKSATTYNWTQYISYPYENDYTKVLQVNRTNSNTITWICGDGIPFYILNPYSEKGQNLISFICSIKHGLSVGEWVELNIPGWNGVNGNYVFQVYSLGHTGYNSDEYIFNIYDNGFPSTDFINSSEGSMKRIIDINNSAETKSKYYVRKHKIITDVTESVLTKAGFDLIGFPSKKQYEFSSLTPDNTARIATKEGNQAYTLTFSKDIDISSYRDNLNRPITELFLTIINKGYFGWFNRPIHNNVSIREGFSFNFGTPIPSYWSLPNFSVNISNIQTGTYNRTTPNGNFVFHYNLDLKSGDTLNGDFCEFNQFEQTERVISEIYHKIWFNPILFNINTNPTLNPPGYYYRPHYPITLKVYSDYIEECDVKLIDQAPDYSYYSQYYQTLRWRDLFTYGFIDEGGSGVDYPFLNGVHYPTSNVIFRVIPEGNIPTNINNVAEPLIDECE